MNPNEPVATDNVTPISEASAPARGKPGPKPKADLVEQARASIRQAAGGMVESAINDIAKIVPGRPGSTEALYWLAGQIRVGVHFADNAGEVIPG